MHKRARPFRITYYIPTECSTDLSWKTGFAEDIEQEHALDCFYYWTQKNFPSELSEPFRQQDVLIEPAIRHAMMAMGILFEIYWHKITGPPETSRKIVAMQHYGKAIQSLLSRHQNCEVTSSRKDKMSISLVACLLFVCLEVSQGHYKSGLAHLQSGFRLFQGVLNERQQRSQTDWYAPQKIIRSLFVRLMCQITHFDSVDCARFLSIIAEPDGHPKHFESLDQARQCFVEVVEKIHPGPQALDTQTNSRALSGLNDLDQWILGFNLYLSHGISDSQTCDAYILAICAYALKYRLSMHSRIGQQFSVPTRMDLAHIAGLGDVFLPIPTSQTAALGGNSSSTCPLHRLFDGKQDVLNENNRATSGQCHFPFLGVFCSLFVSSKYSQDDMMRRKAQDTVSNFCHCGKGWDTGLSTYLVSMLCPAEKGSTPLVHSYHDSFFGRTISTGTRELLQTLRYFHGLSESK